MTGAQDIELSREGETFFLGQEQRKVVGFNKVSPPPTLGTKMRFCITITDLHYIILIHAYIHIHPGYTRLETL